MGWRDWPYWLKGGLITTIVLYIISSIFMTSQFLTTHGMNFTIQRFIIDLYSYPLRIPFLIIPPLIIYFLIGALIGWFVGKVKSKKEQGIIQK